MNWSFYCKHTIKNSYKKMDIGDIKVDIENRKVDVQDKKVDIEQYLVMEKENVNLKGISILTVCIPLII